jgi:formate transporter
VQGDCHGEASRIHGLSTGARESHEAPAPQPGAPAPQGRRRVRARLLAGAFIAFGGIFSTVVLAGASGAPWGATRALAGIVFSVGLILIIVGGAELFTGNNLIVMAWAGGRVSTWALLRNWVLVYAGNVAGGVGIALLAFGARLHEAGGAAVGASALGIAVAKLQLGFVQAVLLGVLCNVLVCLAVWLAYSARSTTDRVLAIVPPIAAFVAAASSTPSPTCISCRSRWFLTSLDPGFVAARGLDAHALTWGDFLAWNLLPVTLGNVIGGAVLVGGVYWFVYLRAPPRA